MKRVLVVATSSQTRGGITSVINAHRLGRQWKDYHCIWIATHIDKNNIVKLSILLIGFIKYIILLPFVDLVHIHLSEPTSARRKLPFFQLARMLNKKVIIHFHSFSPDTTINSKFRARYRTMFVGADAVVVLSNYWKEVVNSTFNIGEKVKVIYNPCPKPSFPDLYKKTKSVLYAGTLNQRKGYADLIKAFAIVSSSYPDWTLVLAGNGEVDKARLTAKEKGIENKIVLLGWINGLEKDKAYKQASVFCLPSYAEGFPMAVLDAWAYGLPVITTPVGGIPDIAKDGENMLLFKPGDINALAACIERIIKDEELRQNLSRSSTLLASTTFNLDTINKQVGDLYNKLLS